MPTPAQRVATFGTTIFTEINTLAQQHNALNLGQGKPDFTPQGAYFIMADYSDIFDGTPIEFTRHLVKEIGVACIPPESFYSLEHAHIGHGYVRFAFCKSDDLLRQVKDRLAKLSK